MIYEVRTYDLVPKTMPEVIKRFGEGYEERKSISEMAAFFYTEIGPLNQIIHIWPYKDENDRAECRERSLSLKGWPPGIGDFITRQTVEIFKPWPFSPLLEPGSFGPYYEYRSYMVTVGKMGEYRARWEKALPTRSERSACSVVMECDIGTASKLVHIWPYESLDQRGDVRKTAEDDGIWPPKGDASIKVIDYQENKILLPASFSPMQ
ncbi:MAG: NIPSNAP family protein [Rhodospirillales bacterium]|nr:NIPSNAP family protein [Rhodospirillales bacterium]